MIRVPMEPSLATRRFLEMAFGTLCTTSLKIRSVVIDFGSNLLNFFSREIFTRRIDCNILDTKIDTEYVLRHNFLWFRNIDYNIKIERSSAKNEIGLASNPIKPRSMVITDPDRNLDSAVECQQRDPIKSFPGHDSLIIDNGSIRFKLWLDRLVSLVGFSRLGDCPKSHLSRETKLFSNLTINNLLRLDFIGCMKLKSLLSNKVAGGVKLMHGLKRACFCSGVVSSLTLRVCIIA